MKLTWGTTLAFALAAGAVGYWAATVKKAATLPPAPSPTNPEIPIAQLPQGIAPGEYYPPQPYPPQRSSPPFARVLPAGSTDAKLMNQLLTQAAAAPQTVDRSLMAHLADWLAADGFQIDAQRVRQAIAHLPPLPPAPPNVPPNANI